MVEGERLLRHARRRAQRLQGQIAQLLRQVEADPEAAGRPHPLRTLQGEADAGADALRAVAAARVGRVGGRAPRRGSLIALPEQQPEHPASQVTQLVHGVLVAQGRETELGLDQLVPLVAEGRGFAVHRDHLGRARRAVGGDEVAGRADGADPDAEFLVGEHRRRGHLPLSCSCRAAVTWPRSATAAACCSVSSGSPGKWSNAAAS